MDKRIALHCEPELSAVRRLLGMRGEADEGIRKVLELELTALRTMVRPVALVRRIRVDEMFLMPVHGIYGDEVSDDPARRMCGADVPVTGSPLAVGEELLAVLLTAGPVDDHVSELFSKGEHLRALVADALLSAWLFAMDDAVQKEIGVWCVRHGFGVCGRLEAPGDLPMELQRVICDRLDSEERAGVHVNDGCMLVPEKSMCYLLRLDRECGRFAMGHDCGRCQKRDCGKHRAFVTQIRGR